ncbi:MAG: HAMP domain-containing histidine kinase [Gemmatimonadetes bacterium]|nr:HAMP domain-containing histidine kinase [Gemmatimonadota bacterium]
MAHDLRSPLTSIISLAELLQSGSSGPVNDTQRRQLGLIYSAALCLCASASDVIELARGGDRLVERVPSPFRVSDVFGEVHDMVLPMAEVKGLSLHLEPPAVDRRIGYPRALNRVLLNLATNAVKYTDTGHVCLAAVSQGEGRLEFSVEDTGTGLDADALQELYQPFRPALNPDRHCFSSFGLGLSICRKLVSAMASELKVETQVTRGTRFFFELDLPPAPEAFAA